MNFQKQSPKCVLQNSSSAKVSTIDRKTPVLDGLVVKSLDSQSRGLVFKTTG